MENQPHGTGCGAAPSGTGQVKTDHLAGLAVKHARLGLWDLDLARRDVFLDASCREFFGLTGQEPLRLDHCLARIHPDDREALLADFNSALNACPNDGLKLEFRIHHPDRGVGWILGLGHFERNENGKPVRLRGLALDLKNSRLIEVSHDATAERYRSLFESISDAVVIVNMEGRILECNPAYLELTGYGGEEIHAMTYRDLTPEKWHEFEAAIVMGEVIPHGHSSTYEKEYRRKDGTLVPVELRTFLIRDSVGNPAQMWAIVRDISQRKASELQMLEWNRALERRVAEQTSALRQSESRFRQLAEATFEGIAICEKGIIVDGNSLLASMFGCRLADLIGKPLRALATRTSGGTVLGDLLGGLGESCEFTALRADGTTFPVEAHAKSAASQLRQIRIIAIRDLTEFKSSQSRIAAQREELEKIQRLALISEVAAGIVHQIGQPLTSMGVNVLTAIRGLDSCINAPCHSIGYVQKVENDVERMREIVHHMRALADPERADHRLCDLNGIIRDILPVVQSIAKPREVAVTFAPGDPLPSVNADSVQLGQMVLNLAKNAAEACAGQERERRAVGIRTRNVGNEWVELIVEDRGTGLPPEVQERLFSPFFSTKSDGFGVGLRLCRTIAESHGGQIVCSNNPGGQGARILVRLPVPRARGAGEERQQDEHPDPEQHPAPLRPGLTGVAGGKTGS